MKIRKSSSVEAQMTSTSFTVKGTSSCSRLVKYPRDRLVNEASRVTVSRCLPMRERTSDDMARANGPGGGCFPDDMLPIVAISQSPFPHQRALDPYGATRSIWNAFRWIKDTIVAHVSATRFGVRDPMGGAWVRLLAGLVSARSALCLALSVGFNNNRTSVLRSGGNRVSRRAHEDDGSRGGA